LKRTLNCRGTLVDLSSPKVMGIVNLTPDSFYEGSRIQSEKELLIQVEKMLLEGATFIDLGAYSSRPGAADLSSEEEFDRLIPQIKSILKEFPNTILSVDTFRSEIADSALTEGASMINDISAGDADAKMFDCILKHQVPYILMHMRGTAKTMTKLNQYQDLIADLIDDLQAKVQQLKSRGLNDIIIDPGLGFAKNLEQSYQIVKQLKSFEILDCPILIGASRKSMIYKLLNCEAKEALNGTTIVNAISLMNGASILRVHDVKEAMEAIEITTQIKL